MSIFRQFLRGTILGLILSTGLLVVAAHVDLPLPPEPEPYVVTTLDDAIEASIPVVCREKNTGRAFATGSAARLYSPKNGKWLLATAAHVTAGCKHTEKMQLVIEPDVDENGNPGLRFEVKRTVLEGNLFAMYHGKEYKLKTRIENKDEDVSLVFTEKKIGGAYPYFLFNNKVPNYQQLVYAFGYPANYNFPKPVTVVTSGHINVPLVSFEQEKGPLLLFIVHDAKTWYGNSGGPMTDDNFKLMGLNVRLEESGRGLATPVWYIQQHLKEIKYHEEIYN